MNYHILAIGDVVGEQGLAHLSKSLRAVKKLKDVHFTVVNGENAAGTGILPRQVEDLYAAENAAMGETIERFGPAFVDAAAFFFARFQAAIDASLSEKPEKEDTEPV